MENKAIAGSKAVINPVYSNKSVIGKLREQFIAEGALLLLQFWQPEFYRRLREKILHLHYHKEILRTSHSYNAAEISWQLKKSMEEQLNYFLSRVLPAKAAIQLEKVFSFSWKDYTILSDEASEEPGTDLILDFTGTWPAEAGGAVVYKNYAGEAFTIPSQGNLLALVKREAGMQSYVQYVNHRAGKEKRAMILGKILLEK